MGDSSYRRNFEQEERNPTSQLERGLRMSKTAKINWLLNVVK
jgi:hypothetical protein